MLFEQKQHLRADMAMIKLELTLLQGNADSKQWLNKQHEAAQNNFDPFDLLSFFKCITEQND